MNRGVRHPWVQITVTSVQLFLSLFIFILEKRLIDRFPFTLFTVGTVLDQTFLDYLSEKLGFTNKKKGSETF